ncbi:MAG: cytochrome c [Actinobacteria bacterium]|nr:cytochrome c [Actinomycetota bacterium]
MQTTLFILAWAIAAAIVVAFGFRASRGEGKDGVPTALGRVPLIARFGIALVALAAIVGLPALLTASASDRVPSAAGTYTIDASDNLQEGRQIFRETCASCHTLTAASARGSYGPSLDALGLDADGSDKRVEKAIKNGGASGMQMPKDLLEGEDAKLVAEYVAAVAGK